MKNILILYTSSGYGHKKIAENIAEVLSPENAVDLVDLFEVEKGKLASWGTKTYLWVLKNIPWLWEFFYTNKLFLKLTLPFRTKVAKFKSLRVANLLLKKKYDWVITTQVSASAIVSSLKQRGLCQAKFGVTFSDFHLHPYWLFENVDMYIANIPEQKEQMVSLGVSAEKIIVAGITMPDQKSVDQQSVRNMFGLKQDEKVVLVLGGGRGLGFDEQIVSEIAQVNAKVFVICGMNTKLQNSMEQYFAKQPNVIVLGFVDYLNQLYSIASVVVTKPGGLTIAECLSFKIPIVVPETLPGQEKLNYDYLADRRLIMPNFVDIRGMIEDELKTGSFARELALNKDLTVIVQHGSAIKDGINRL